MHRAEEGRKCDSSTLAQHSTPLCIRKVPLLFSVAGFGICGSFLIILSLLHSQRNLKSCNKIYHIASNLLPITVPWKIGMFTVQLYSKASQPRSDAKSFNYKQISTRDVTFSFIGLRRLILKFYSVCSKYPPSAYMHNLSSARRWSMDASVAHFQCCAK